MEAEERGDFSHFSLCALGEESRGGEAAREARRLGRRFEFFFFARIDLQPRLDPEFEIGIWGPHQQATFRQATCVAPPWLWPINISGRYL